METGWSLVDTGVSLPYQWSPNVSHISQSSTGVRLTSAVTSSCCDHVTWECVEVQFPPRTSAQFCCYKKKFWGFDCSRCSQRCCMGLAQCGEETERAQRSGWSESRAGGKNTEDINTDPKLQTTFLNQDAFQLWLKLFIFCYGVWWISAKLKLLQNRKYK